MTTMDEFQIAMLQANGYDYIHGGIVDSDGNYLRTLELEGQIFKSESSEEFVLENLKLDYLEANKPLIFSDEEITNSSEITGISKSEIYKPTIKTEEKEVLPVNENNFLVSLPTLFVIITGILFYFFKNKVKFLRNLFLISILNLIGFTLAFFYKLPDSLLLRNSLSKNTKWKQELYIEWVESRTSFFELDGNGYGGFEFNWYVYLSIIMLGFLILFLVSKTTVFNFLKPYLK